MTTRITLLAALPVLHLVCLLGPVGCGNSADTDGKGTGAAIDVPWLVRTAPPAEALDVGAAKGDSAVGDEIVVRARIGGRKDPMSEDQAVFVVIDAGLPSCADIPGDTCATPWDYCCETPESLRANTATIQVADAEGGPVMTSPASVGLEPLDEVVVVGRVVVRDEAGAFVVEADRIHLVERG